MLFRSEGIKLVKRQSFLSKAEIHPSDQVIDVLNDRQEHSADGLSICLTHLPIFSKQHVVRHSATEVKYVEVVFNRHLKVVEGIHSLNGSICDRQEKKTE